MADQLKLGLALGGGGARGLAHIGVLKVLEEEGLRVSAIAGTSMGGLIGAYYAAGIPLDQIARLANHGNTKDVLRHLFDITLSPRGFLKGDLVERTFRQALGEKANFQDLNIPLALPTTDLRTGQEVVLDWGPLVPALRATCAVPGVFLPVDYKNMSLADGGLLNNLPVDVVKGMDVDVVMAINVLPDFDRNQAGRAPRVTGLRPRNIPPTLREQIHVNMIMISALTAQKLAQCPPDILLRPLISDRVGLFAGYDRTGETIEAGATAARLQVPKLRQLLGLAPPGRKKRRPAPVG